MKKGGDFGEFFLASVSHETKHEKFGENSEQNSGQNSGRKFEKFGELSVCNFSDLTFGKDEVGPWYNGQGS